MKPSRRRKIPEKTVEQYLVERVIALGGDAPKLDLRHQDRLGRTDRLVLFPSLNPRRDLAFVVYVEVKAAGEPPASHQLREHERLRALGFNVRVVWSYEDVDALLAPFERH